MFTYYIITFGCQMNFNDSERIARVTESLKFKKATEKLKADLVIINTCAVRQSAEDRVLGIVPEIRKKNPAAKIIITGCSARRPDFQKKIAGRADYFIDILDVPLFLKKMAGSAKGTKKISKNNQTITAKTATFFKLKPRFSSPYSAYIPIMTGCNNFCSYCVVPYARGKEFSRPSKDILQEAKNLVTKGYKEIVLLGQNVNSYNPENYRGEKLKNFPELLKKVSQIPGDFWIRFLTSHPKDMTDELIKAVADSDKITNYIHLPFQAGSDRILRLMQRNYTSKHYLKLIAKIRAAIPQASISTDVIVGFPGEKKKDFEKTARIMEVVGFDMAYISAFSVRPGTPAAKLEDNVSREEKKRRKQFLTEILKKTAYANNRRYIGRKVKVLVEREKKRFSEKEGKQKEIKIYSGKTETYKNTRFKEKSGKKIQTGTFQKVKITKAGIFGLESYEL